jgi:hypothetical protein
MLLEESEGIADEFLVVGQSVAQTQLGQHQALKGHGECIAVGVIDRSTGLLWRLDQRQESISQTIEIPLPDMRLVAVGVAALMVGVVADVAGIEGLHETERAVIQRQAEDGHVVGIHHAVHETNRHPVRHQFAGAAGNVAQQGVVGIWRGPAFGPEGVDDVIGQLLQFEWLVGAKTSARRSRNGRSRGQRG